MTATTGRTTASDPRVRCLAGALLAAAVVLA